MLQKLLELCRFLFDYGSGPLWSFRVTLVLLYRRISLMSEHCSLETTLASGLFFLLKLLAFQSVALHALQMVAAVNRDQWVLPSEDGITVLLLVSQLDGQLDLMVVILMVSRRTC